MIVLVEPCEKYLQSSIEAYDEYKQNDVHTYAFDDARAYDTSGETLTPSTASCPSGKC